MSVPPAWAMGRGHRRWTLALVTGTAAVTASITAVWLGTRHYANYRINGARNLRASTHNGKAGIHAPGAPLAKRLLAKLDVAKKGGQPFAKEVGPLPPLSAGARSALYAESLLDMSSEWQFPRFGRCILAEEVWRLSDEQLEQDLYHLIRGIPAAARRAGVEVSFSRFDLFHGHLFQRFGGAGLGLLLHKAEYPARCEITFAIDLGFCQRGSTLTYDDAQSRFRNIVVLLPEHGSARAFALDAAAPVVSALIPEYARAPLYTLDESALGVPLADVFFLPNEGNASAPLGWVPRGRVVGSASATGLLSLA